MGARTPAGLLDLPAHEGARWVALRCLAGVRRAHARLGGGDDVDALHAFHVALRRLRSVIRAYRGVIDDSVPKKVRRRLARIAAAAGSRRDADVHLEWLAAEQHDLSRAETRALARLERALRREWRSTGRALADALDRDYARTSASLERRLRHYRVPHTLGEPREVKPFRVAISRAVVGLAGELSAALDDARELADDRSLHRARIAAKRLRYALEPLCVENDGATGEAARVARDAVSRLKALQDELGLVHDAHVLESWLADRVAEGAARAARRSATAPRADGKVPAPSAAGDLAPLALALRDRLRARAADQWESFDAAPNRKELARLIRSVASAARRLGAPRPRRSRRRRPPARSPKNASAATTRSTRR